MNFNVDSESQPASTHRQSAFRITKVEVCFGPVARLQGHHCKKRGISLQNIIHLQAG